VGDLFMYFDHGNGKSILTRKAQPHLLKVPLKNNLKKHATKLRMRLQFIVEALSSVEASLVVLSNKDDTREVPVAIANAVIVDDTITMVDLEALLGDKEDTNLNRIANDILDIDEIIQNIHV